MAIQIKLRRGTAAEWSAANPVLQQGEIVIITDTRSLRVGDGTTQFNSLTDLFPGPQGPNGQDYPDDINPFFY